MCKYLEKPVDSGYNEEKNWKVAVNPLHSHITGNIYQIDVPLPKSPLRNLNAYLIRGKDRNLLIDTGYRRPECRAALEEGLRELNVSMDDTDIFLTHMHSDHSGLVTDIAGRDSRIFVSREDGERLRTLYTIASRDLQRLTLYQGGVPEPTAKLVMASPLIDYGCKNFTDYVPVEPGDKLEYGGHSFTALSVPGHSPGQLCLYEERRAAMVLGDHVLFDITPNITCWNDYEDALGAYVRSLIYIQGFDVDIPMPGHRGVTCGMVERIDTIIEHHASRIREVLALMSGCPPTTAYDLAGRMSWNMRGGWDRFPPSQKWFATGETIAHLDYLIARDEVERTCRDGVYYYERRPL